MAFVAADTETALRHVGTAIQGATELGRGLSGRDDADVVERRRVDVGRVGKVLLEKLSLLPFALQTRVR